jgi:phosphoribosylaminoimidazolecarboxamide formyltransferase/IMP cyclohydrolase
MSRRRALVSVSDKTGVVELARGLTESGFELVSTGGTMRELSDAGLPVTSVSEVTRFPEILGGRVKTLHPHVFAGLLADRRLDSHRSALTELKIGAFELAVVNLYPFEQHAFRYGVDPEQVIEQIDVGGPSMVRAAAKNHANVSIVVDPADYGEIVGWVTEGEVPLEVRRRLAAKAFALTARYDAMISRWFAEGEEEGEFPDHLVRAYSKASDLTYGENPHQRAAFYVEVGARRHLMSRVEQLHGKELSFNNLNDLDTARAVVEDFAAPACAIIKHANPCGVALGHTLEEAFRKALAGDPVSAFGGVIAVNRPLDEATAALVADQFVEVLLAPDYEGGSFERLTQRKNVRILANRERRRRTFDEMDLKRVHGGLLLQDRDQEVEERDQMRVVSERRPTEREWDDLLFAWTVCRHVKSNGIAIAKDLATVGLGAGQTSRVDSVRLAIDKAREFGHDLEGAALASDAFFPFSDGPGIALEAGITAIVQPGGSRRDEDTIDAVDEAGAAMLFTDRRHFRH